VTFEQVAIEWLRWGEHERGWKRSTLVDRRSVLNRYLRPAFGTLPVNQITTRRVEAWKIRCLAEHDSRRQGAKLLAILHGIMERARRAYDLPRNPVGDVDRIRIRWDRRRAGTHADWIAALLDSGRQDAGIGRGWRGCCSLSEAGPRSRPATHSLRPLMRASWRCPACRPLTGHFIGGSYRTRDHERP
jgi:hypothetical protein